MTTLSRDDAHKLGLEAGTSIDLSAHYELMQSTHYEDGGMTGMDQTAIAEIVRQTTGRFETDDIIELSGDVPISPFEPVGRMFPPSWHRRFLEGTNLPIHQVLGTLVFCC